MKNKKIRKKINIICHKGYKAIIEAVRGDKSAFKAFKSVDEKERINKTEETEDFI